MRVTTVCLLLSILLPACGSDGNPSKGGCNPGETRRCTNADVTKVGEQTCRDNETWSKCEFYETSLCATPPSCAPCPGETDARDAVCIDGQPRCPQCPASDEDSGTTDDDAG